MLGATKQSVALLLALVLALNVGYIVYFGYYRNGNIGVAALSIALGTKYYLVDSEWATTNDETAKLAKNAKLVALSEEEIKQEIASRLRKEAGPLYRSAEEAVKNEHTEEYKKILMADLKGKYAKDYSSLFFWKMEKSQLLLHELKEKYLVTHETEIKNLLVQDIVGDTLDRALKAKIELSSQLRFDKQKYYKFIFEELIFKNTPNSKKIGSGAMGTPLYGLGVSEVRKPPFSRKHLGRVSLRKELFNELQNTHDSIVRSLRTLPIPPPELYSGDGIAISASKVHLPGAIAVVRQLRELGSELPVEVMINSESDYNKQACEEILPKLQAKCVVMERELGEEIYGKLSGGFPMKGVSLLLSSFDNTIVLDADNFPVKKPDFLLVSQPFLSTRFILWPDNWHKGTSPLYYELARFQAGEPVRRQGWNNDKPFSEYISMDRNKEIMFHDLDGIPAGHSVESGQLVFSKREHFRSLVLSTYYNIFGEKFYYPLLYQGTFGSGDRETFVPALHVMQEPYYLTGWEMKFLGVDREKATEPGKFYFDESTMVQHDPQQAMEFGVQWKKYLNSKNLDSRLEPHQEGEYTAKLLTSFFNETKTERPEALFLHVHDPKINPLGNEVSKKTINDYKHRYIRKIGQLNDVVGTTDWELRFHSIAKWVACEALTDETIWKDFEVDQKKICKKVTEYVEILKKDSNTVEVADLSPIE